MRWLAGGASVLALAGALLGCDGPGGRLDPGDDAGPAPPDAAGCLEARELQSGSFSVDRPCRVELHVARVVVADLWVDRGQLVEGAASAAYVGPRRFDAGTHVFVATEAAGVTVRVLGEPPGATRIERSLTWTDPALLDDPATVGLARLMGTLGDRPGALLEAWFRRFGTTAHSERLGPSRILEEVIAAQGPDPAGWDLDQLPFRVTGVHHRLDLADGTHCGQLRVSLASTHPLHAPFHLIFLYQRAPMADDLRPDGTAHCAATALALARLGVVDEAEFRASARALLDEALTRSRFLVAESLEFIISPWEWRQWFLEPSDGPLPEVLENRPLFQTVDAPRLNAPGPDRDAFLAWVATEADALAARRATIPEAFRAPSARVNDGVPWVPLDLSGLPPELTEAYPTLRQQIEIVGCPACHATDADFVQTRPDRTFSPFYARELDARAVHLEAVAVGEPPPWIPHGPLQPEPRLPP